MARSPAAPGALARRAKTASALAPQGVPFAAGILLVSSCLVAAYYMAGQAGQDSLTAGVPDQHAPRQGHAQVRAQEQADGQAQAQAHGLGQAQTQPHAKAQVPIGVGTGPGGGRGQDRKRNPEQGRGELLDSMGSSKTRGAPNQRVKVHREESTTAKEQGSPLSAPPGAALLPSHSSGSLLPLRHGKGSAPESSREASQRKAIDGARKAGPADARWSLQCAGDKGSAELLQASEAIFEESTRRRADALAKALKPPHRGFSAKHFIEQVLVPQYACPLEEHLGSWGSDSWGKWVCLGLCGLANSRIAPPTVVTLGAGGNHSFAVEAVKMLSARAVVLDPMLQSPRAQELVRAGVEVQRGLGVVGHALLARVQREYPAVEWRSMGQALAAVQAPFVDILVVDCRECEFRLEGDLQGLGSRGAPAVGQLVLALSAVKDRSVEQLMALMHGLERLGFRLFQADARGSCTWCFDLAFVHEILVKPPRLPAAPAASLKGPYPLCRPACDSARTEALKRADEAFSRNQARRSKKLKAFLKAPSRLSKERLKDSMMMPLYSCPAERRLGQWGEGGKWLCMAACKMPGGKRPVIVSVGSNGDASFEKDAKALFGVLPHTFDPFLGRRARVRLRSTQTLVLHSVGLAGAGDIKGMKAKHPKKKWTTVQGLLQRIKASYVDVLKIDCEGCEWGVVQEMKFRFKRNSPAFGELLMEVHDLGQVKHMMDILMILENLGYRLFHAEVNAFSPWCFELGFIHEKLVRQ